MNIAEFSTSGRFDGISNLVRLQREPVDVASFVFANPERRPIAAIASEFARKVYPDIPWSALIGESRKKTLVRARHHMWWHVRQMRPDASASEMGRQFRRGHDVIAYGIAAHEKRMNQ